MKKFNKLYESYTLNEGSNNFKKIITDNLEKIMSYIADNQYFEHKGNLNFDKYFKSDMDFDMNELDGEEFSINIQGLQEAIVEVLYTEITDTNGIDELDEMLDDETLTKDQIKTFIKILSKSKGVMIGWGEFSFYDINLNKDNLYLTAELIGYE